MSIQQAATVGMPIALGIIMFGVGLHLRPVDFARVAVYPKAVLVGLACQTLLLPFAAFAIAKLFGMGAALGVGLMLLAASPGGATANFFSHLAGGDVALNVTLTAINSVLSIVSLPIIVNLSLLHFMGEGQAVPLQFAKVVQVFVIVLGPVALGMLLRGLRSHWADAISRPLKILSIVILFGMLTLAIYNDRANLAQNLHTVGLACLAFNLASLTVGYWVPRWTRLDRRQSIAISMEVGIHNATLAITLALSPLVLNNPTMAVPPAIYSVIMLITAGVFAWMVVRRGEGAPAPAGAERTPLSR